MVYIRDEDRREELYDLIADPAELHNLSQSPDAQPSLARFRDKMKEIDAAKKG